METVLNIAEAAQVPALLITYVWIIRATITTKGSNE